MTELVMRLWSVEEALEDLSTILGTQATLLKIGGLPSGLENRRLEGDYLSIEFTQTFLQMLITKVAKGSELELHEVKSIFAVAISRIDA